MPLVKCEREKRVVTCCTQFNCTRSEHTRAKRGESERARKRMPLVRRGLFFFASKVFCPPGDLLHSEHCHSSPLFSFFYSRCSSLLFCSLSSRNYCWRRLQEGQLFGECECDTLLDCSCVHAITTRQPPPPPSWKCSLSQLVH